MILITGCTGFVGLALARRLAKAGKKVRGLARHPERLKNLEHTNIDWIRGDILDRVALTKAMQDVDQVVHLVGILFENRSATFEQIHTTGSQNVVDIAQQAGVKRYLHMSALGTGPEAKSRYHRSKWQAEEYVRSSKLNATIFRPSVIFGPRDKFTNQFAQIARYSPIMPILGNGQAKMQPIWIGDLVHCLAHALDDPTTINTTFELGGPEQLTFEEIIDAILKTTGKARIKLRLPFPLLKLNATILERFFAHPPITTDQLIMAQENNICANAVDWQRFGIVPRYFHEGIQDYLLSQ